jgi:hypothetical protein
MTAWKKSGPVRILAQLFRFCSTAGSMSVAARRPMWSSGANECPAEMRRIFQRFSA